LQERLFANPKVEVLWETVVEEITGDPSVSGIRVKNVKTGETRSIDVGGVFVFIGFKPNSNILEGTRVERDLMGHIHTNQFMETAEPGIYAAGDIRVQLARQVTTAVGDATTAALAAEKYIEALNEKPLDPEPLAQAKVEAVAAT
jgi:thioredoxin reductase (NADPH)